MKLCVIAPWGVSAPPMSANVCALDAPLRQLGASGSKDIAETPGGSIPPDPNAGVWLYEGPDGFGQRVMAVPQLAACVVYCDGVLPPDGEPEEAGYDAAISGLATLLGVPEDYVRGVVGPAVNGRTRQEIVHGSVIPFVKRLRRAGAAVPNDGDYENATAAVATRMRATPAVVALLSDPANDCEFCRAVKEQVRAEAYRLADAKQGG